MKRVLITGMNGFVSRYLRQELETSGYAVRGIDLAASGPDVIQCNLLEPDSLASVLEANSPDVIFHLAGQSSVAKSWRDPALTFDVNVKGTIHLLEAMRSVCPKAKLLLVGSSDQYGKLGAGNCLVNEETPLKPTTPYAISKCTQEQLGQLYASVYGMSVYMTRSFNHVGAGQAKGFVIADIASGIAEIEAGLSDKLLIGNMEAQRDFTDVGDVVRAYRLIIERGSAGTVYNVGSGRAVKISELLEILIGMAKSDIRVKTDASRMRASDTPLIQCDYSRLWEDTGWSPEIDIRDSLKTVLDWYRAQTKV